MGKTDMVSFEGYSIENFSMKKRKDIPEDKKNLIDINYHAYANNDRKSKKIYCAEFKIKLYTKISELYIEFDGFFTISDSLKEEDKNYFLNVTAATILYPYIRTFISNVTAFDTGEAVILPVINFADKD